MLDLSRKVFGALRAYHFVMFEFHHLDPTAPLFYPVDVMKHRCDAPTVLQDLHSEKLAMFFGCAHEVVLVD